MGGGLKTEAEEDTPAFSPPPSKAYRDLRTPKSRLAAAAVSRSLLELPEPVSPFGGTIRGAIPRRYELSEND